MRGKAAACEKRAALAVTGGSAPFALRPRLPWGAAFPRCFHRSFRCSTHPFHIFYLPFFVKIRYKERGFIMGKAGLWFKRLWKRLRSFRFTKKRVLLVSAVLAAAALGFGVWRFLRPAGGALPAMADAVRTTRLEKPRCQRASPSRARWRAEAWPTSPRRSPIPSRRSLCRWATR